MPQPTAGDVHVNRPLTNISVAFAQNNSNFIAGDVFPIVPVQKQSDQYWEYDRSYWNRDDMQLVAPGDEPTGGGYKVAQGTYFANVWKHKRDIADEIRANADTPINLDREATEWLTRKALIRREKEFVDKFFKAGVWSNDFTGVAGTPSTNEVMQWNDLNSTPIEDIWNAKEISLAATGFEPNTLVLGYKVYNRLVNHPEFIDRVKAGQTPGRPAMIDQSDLAQLFKVDRVFIMRAIETTSVEGNATQTSDFIGGGKGALLCYSAPSPGLLTPSAGYIFSWQGYLGAGPDGQRIKKFRVEERSSDRVQIEIAFDMKRISADLGAFYADLVA